MYHIFFIYSSIIGHLGCCQVLGIIVLQWTLGYMCHFELWFSQGIQGISPVERWLGHMVVLCLVFKRDFMLFSTVTVSIYTSNNCSRGFPFLYTLSKIYHLQIFFFLIMAILTGMRLYLIIVLIFTYLKTVTIYNK